VVATAQQRGCGGRPASQIWKPRCTSDLPGRFPAFRYRDAPAVRSAVSPAFRPVMHQRSAFATLRPLLRYSTIPPSAREQDGARAIETAAITGMVLIGPGTRRPDESTYG